MRSTIINVKILIQIRMNLFSCAAAVHSIGMTGDVALSHDIARYFAHSIIAVYVLHF